MFAGFQKAKLPVKLHEPTIGGRIDQVIRRTLCNEVVTLFSIFGLKYEKRLPLKVNRTIYTHQEEGREG